MRALPWLTLVFLWTGCAATSRTAAPEVRLRSPSAAPPFRYRQEVTVAYGEEAPRSFEAVLENTGDALRLVGLTPLNTVLFVVELAGGEVTFENRTGEALPFDPSYILRDVQRAFFPWLEGGEGQDGARRGRVAGVKVLERYEGGRLIERVFFRPGAPPVRARYGRDTSSPVVRLVDPELDYRLEIRTFAPP